MNILQLTVKAVKKQPLILAVTGSAMLITGIINLFVPAMALVVGVINMTEGNILDSLMSIFHILLEPEIISTVLVILAAMILAASIIAGLVLPFFLLMVGNAIAKGEKKQRSIVLFTEGLKKHFLKFFFMTMDVLALTVVLAVFLIVASIPAVVVTKLAITSKPDLMVGALFIDFITIVVAFFSFSFYKVYIFMWFAAASKGERKPFKTGKAVGDTRFWSITLGLLIFDLVFSAAIFLIYQSESQIFRYTAGWVFATAYFTVLSVYIIQTFQKGPLIQAVKKTAGLKTTAKAAANRGTRR